MTYEVKASDECTGDWVAGAVADPPEGDGDIYVAIFSGPLAKERAKEYADWKNASRGDLSSHSVNTLL